MSFAKIRPRRGTANQWNNANPILAEGEIGIEVPSTGVGTGTVKIKFGDGSSHWNDLPYGIDPPNDVSDVISDEFIAGTPCASGNYYIANNKLYKCIADTDGSINVTNSNYFEETSVAGEVKALNGRLSDLIKVKSFTREPEQIDGEYNIGIDVSMSGYVPMGVVGFDVNNRFNTSVTSVLLVGNTVIFKGFVSEPTTLTPKATVLFLKA